MGAKHVSQAERDFIADAYTKMPLAQVVEQVNERFGVSRTWAGMKQYVRKYGIQSGRAVNTGCFPKGLTPWNKGKKGVNGRSDTVFKPGNTPPQTRPMFSERTGKDGEVQIKVREHGKTFVAKHRWLWEQKNGPVPRGHIIRFKDGDNRNFAEDNLICVSRHLHLRLNASDYAELPPALKPSRLLVERLVVTVKERARA